MRHEAGSYITRARRVLTNEETRVRDEIDALRAFQQRIDDAKPVAVAARGPAGPTSVRASSAVSASHAGVEQIRAGYRETVMAVAHYDEDYGDSIDESLSEEFGPGLATALRTQSTLSAMVKSRLTEAVQTSIDQREEFHEAIRAELASLSTTQNAVSALSAAVDAHRDRPLAAHHPDELFALWETTCDLRERCDAIAAERQRTLPTETVAIGDEQVPRIVYYYRSLPVDYPALNDIARVGEQIDELQASVEHFLTRF